MKLAWKNICKGKPDKLADLREALADGRNAFTFLAEILELRIENERGTSERDNYDLENWALKQADSVGSVRTYKEILELIKSVVDK